MSQANPTATARGRTKKAADNYESWFGPWRLLLLVLGLMLVTFPDVFFKGQVFTYRDAGIFNYPTHFYYRECILNGELPLWNPFSNCGIPFLAQWNVMVLYPLSLFFLLPAPWSMTLFSLAHLLVAVFGMYALAYRWTNNRFAASVAGLAFGWNGLTMHAALMWPNSCASYAWMPWTILLMHRAMQERGRFILYAGMLGGLQMLAGVPEIILFTWLIVLGLFVVELIMTKSPRVIVGAVVAGLIVTGLAAAQLLPFLELLQHSQRGAAYATDSWSMPPWGWANFFVPAFRTSPDFLGVFNQTEQQWTTTYYLGTAMMALGVLAAWRAREPRVWLLVILSLIGCVFALGKHAYIYDVVKKAIPFLGIMRYPSKWVQFPMFCVPLLAAFAVAWLRARETDERATGHRDLMKIGAGILLVIGVVLWAAKAHQRADDEPWQVAFMNGGVRAVLCVAILGLVANLFSQVPILSKRNTALIILALMGLDVSFHQPKRAPTVSAAAYKPRDFRNEMAYVPKLGDSRAMLSAERKTTMRKAGYYEPFQDFKGKRVTLFMNANLYDHIPKVDGLFSLYIKQQSEIEQQLYVSNKFSATPSPSKPLLDFLGVAAMSHPSPDIEFLFSWISRESFLPIGTIGQKPQFVNDDESLARVMSEEFNPKEIVYLPEEAENTIKAKTSVPTAKAEQKEFTAHRVVYGTDSPEPTWLVLAQTHYRHWKAYVDGAETPVWRANHAFQAVEVPAGKHEVRFVYEDKTFRLGLIISLVTLGVVLLAWFFVKKNASAPPVPTVSAPLQ